MKAILLPLLIALVTLTAGAQTQSTTAALNAEQARRTALLTGDVRALEALLADDLHYVHSGGSVENKRVIMDMFSTKKLAYERFDLSRLEAREITPEVVVVTGSIDQRKVINGKATDLKLLFQAVWRLDAGAWRQVALQTARPPAPNP